MTARPGAGQLEESSFGAAAANQRESTYTSMLDLPPVRSGSTPVLASAGTIAVHVAVMALAMLGGTHVVRETALLSQVTEMIEVELPEPRAPLPEAPAPEAPASEPERIKPVARVRAPEPPQVAEPPPAAAQAGQVLSAPDEVVDFGNTLVTGNGTNFAGGTTESGGTATHAVRDTNARAAGVPGGKGTVVAVDRSRPPQLAGGMAWDCPFPEEADELGIDQAVVTLQVDIAADGRVQSAHAAKDPGHGFGREARRCALRKRWVPGLDRAGRPAMGAQLINVRFKR